MNRKDFIKTCSTYCVGGLGITTLLNSCASSNYYAVSTVDNKNVVLKKSEFLYVKESKEKIRAFVLVKNEKLEFPVALYRFGETEYAALILKCTHQGCEVNPYPDYLVCPCHGSEYSNHGRVLQPPADRNLDQYSVSVEGDNIIIHVEP